jgi:cytochrome d ubiquinol oxidase subunit II
VPEAADDHGQHQIAIKLQRAAAVANWSWWGVVVLTVVITWVTFQVQPHVGENFRTWPAGYTLPALAIAGIAGVQFELRQKRELNAFLASCLYLLGMLTSVVFGVYPLVLPARDHIHDLTISNAKAGAYGLKIGLVWWIIGMILAAGYFTYVYRTFAGKVTSNPEGGHSHYRN